MNTLLPVTGLSVTKLRPFKKVLRKWTILKIVTSIKRHYVHDVFESSVFLETYEGILIFPNLDDTWDAHFKSENQLMMFELKYSEFL